MSASDSPTEFLFSYGTLQLEAVQIALFNRRLKGSPDALPEFVETLVDIDDPATIAMSGKTRHAMAIFTGNASNAIAGTVFELTADEVERADTYEVAAYKRVAVSLRSGIRAWAYVDARYTPSGS